MNGIKLQKDHKRKRQISMLSSLYAICFVVGAASLYEGYLVVGTGLILAGLILHLETKVKALRPDSQITHLRGAGGDLTPDDEPVFYLDLVHARIKERAGWDSLELYPKRKKYERECCFGGPPTYTERWEYEIKDGECVFVRLRDRYYDDLYESHRYEIANGCIQTSLVERENRKHEEQLRSRPEQDYYPAPYNVAEMQREVEWHEAEGACRYFILANDGSSTRWKEQIEKLQTSFSKIAIEAEALGATCDEFGDYVLPKGADEQSRQKLTKLFSEDTLLKRYGVRSLHEWRQRDKILLLIAPNEQGILDT